MLLRHLVIVLATLASINIASAGCIQTARWPVKIAADNDASKIATIPEKTTIANLISIQAPDNPNTKEKSRFAPSELKTFQISGVVTIAKRNLADDLDYQLIIADPAHPDMTLIAVAVEWPCAPNSRYFEQIKAIRRVVVQKFGKIARAEEPNVPVTVTGVGFFNPVHGLEGAAPNGIELHPIITISFPDRP